MKKRMITACLVLAMAACLWQPSAIAEKYSDTQNNSFLADADMLEEESNDKFGDADKLEFGKWMGGSITGEDSDTFFAQMKAGKEYVLFVLLENVEDYMRLHAVAAMGDGTNVSVDNMWMYPPASNNKSEKVFLDFLLGVPYTPKTNCTFFLSLGPEENLGNEKALYQICLIQKGENTTATPQPEPLKRIPFSSSVAYFTRVPFASASASSELSSGGITFKAEYAIDDTSDDGKKRPWIEGSSGEGIGETLTLKFSRKEPIRLLAFDLGYARDEGRYYKNSRPSKLVLKFSDGSKLECEFDDQFATQYVYLNHAVETDYVEITISSVYTRSTEDWSYWYNDKDTGIFLVRAYKD